MVAAPQFREDSTLVEYMWRNSKEEGGARSIQMTRRMTRPQLLASLFLLFSFLFNMLCTSSSLYNGVYELAVVTS